MTNPDTIHEAPRPITARLVGKANQGIDWLTTERRALIGAALTRIGLGLAGLYLYVREYPVREYLWGPHGVWPFGEFSTSLREGHSFSLYAISDSSWWFELVFHCGALTALLFMLGWRTRTTTILHFVFLWSLYQRSPMILDGGDNIASIILVYLILVDSGARLSLDARRRAGKPAVTTTSVRYRLLSLLHHAGVIAVVLQVCTVYLVSGMYKVQGERWQNGTALYYILRVDEFTWPGVNRLIYEHAPLVVLLTYGTVFFQLAFSFLLLQRRLRPFAVSLGILLHLGIAVHMGLLTFSLIMISAELLIMGDGHYRALFSRVAAIRRRWTVHERRARTRSSPEMIETAALDAPAVSVSTTKGSHL